MYKDPPHSDHDGRGSKDEAAGDQHEGAREVAEGGVVDEAVEGARDEGHEGTHQRQAGEHSPNLALVHTLAETYDVLSVPGRGLFSENLIFSRTYLYLSKDLANAYLGYWKGISRQPTNQRRITRCSTRFGFKYLTNVNKSRNVHGEGGDKEAKTMKKVEGNDQFYIGDVEPLQ